MSIPRLFVSWVRISVNNTINQNSQWKIYWAYKMTPFGASDSFYSSEVKMNNRDIGGVSGTEKSRKWIWNSKPTQVHPLMLENTTTQRNPKIIV